jgi:hypothetical protein
MLADRVKTNKFQSDNILTFNYDNAGRRSPKPSSAAVCKWWFCGLLLRSKTTKVRLKTGPFERLVINGANLQIESAVAFDFALAVPLVSLR